MIVYVRAPEGETRLSACSDNCAAAVMLQLGTESASGVVEGQLTNPGDCTHCAWCGHIVDSPLSGCFWHTECPEYSPLHTTTATVVLRTLASDDRVTLTDSGVRHLVEAMDTEREAIGYVDPASVLTTIRALRRHGR